MVYRETKDTCIFSCAYPYIITIVWLYNILFQNQLHDSNLHDNEQWGTIHVWCLSHDNHVMVVSLSHSTESLSHDHLKSGVGSPPVHFAASQHQYSTSTSTSPSTSTSTSISTTSTPRSTHRLGNRQCVRLRAEKQIMMDRSVHVYVKCSRRVVMLLVRHVHPWLAIRSTQSFLCQPTNRQHSYFIISSIECDRAALPDVYEVSHVYTIPGNSKPKCRNPRNSSWYTIHCCSCGYTVQHLSLKANRRATRVEEIRIWTCHVVMETSCGKYHIQLLTEK